MPSTVIPPTLPNHLARWTLKRAKHTGCFLHKNTVNLPKKSLSIVEHLESELAFTYDTLATITVMFDSLRHAYVTCKSDIDKTRVETRLGDMEKELLFAYDDLGLQVLQLERQIIKLEVQLDKLKFVSNDTQSRPDAVRPCYSPVPSDRRTQPVEQWTSYLNENPPLPHGPAYHHK